jgi:hypothetical protein
MEMAVDWTSRYEQGASVILRETLHSLYSKMTGGVRECKYPSLALERPFSRGCKGFKCLWAIEYEV